MDIGSNTVRVLIAEGVGPDLRRRDLRRRMTRLGGGFRGNISADAMRRTVEAAKDFADFARSEGVRSVHLACTGVVRKAGNRDEFLRLLEKETGLGAVVLSGDEEAQLAGLGARHHLGADFPEMLMVDCGGFSTELAVVNREVGRRGSYDIGVVTLTESHLLSDPPKDEELQAVRRLVAQRLGDFFRGPVPETLVGIAGTATTIAAMDMKLDPYDPVKVHRHRIREDTLRVLFEDMSRLEEARRPEAFPGLEEGRRDLMPVGMIIVLEVMRLGGFDHMVISEGGLLDGLLLVGNRPPPSGLTSF